MAARPHARARQVMAALAALSLTGSGLLLGAASAGPAAGADRQTRPVAWHLGDPPLSTPWTDQVSPTNALPEYPRPQLRRHGWRSLNGVWEFAAAAEGQAPPVGRTLGERILVPYPTESALSGIQRHEDRMFYRRTFTVPASWQVGRGQRLRLNFGAVDYAATVWVNGTRVARHTGGYDKFSADVTRALRPGARQEVVVGVEDRADDTWQPVGKQRRVADRGIFYTGASGIWQSVWMEPVAARGFIRRLDVTPDIDTSTLRLAAATGGESTGAVVRVVLRAGERRVSTTTGPADRPFRVRVPNARLWSPAHPYLYRLAVTLRRGGRVVDRVASYVGMREIGTKRGADGRLHITLNHKILFLMSTLDQGYWPDGIYTAPTDRALRSDIAMTKRLGFNTIRKHIKVEPDRWYYHADKLGMLVWQDMPAMKVDFGKPRAENSPPPDARREFERELRTMVAQHRSWTSIIGWIPFNEGWGEWSRDDTGRIADAVARQDPSRLVDAHSGVNCCNSLGDSGQGDVIDWHQYTGPGAPSPTADRVAIDGEHGGFGLEVPGHMWFEDGGAYQMAADKAELTDLYVANQRTVLRAAQTCGISGAVYTQTTDVEHEVNGFLTYDRRVRKMDFASVRAVNRRIVRRATGAGLPAGQAGPGTPGLAGTHAYPFDEGAGSTAADAVGDADATLSGGASWAPGVHGSSLALDGTGVADTGRALVDTAGSYSVSAWARLDAADGAFQTVASQDTGSASAFFLQYSGADQRWAMSFVGVRALSPTKPEVGRWYHLTGVRDAAKGTLSLYVDGQRVATQDACFADASTGHTVVGRGQYDGKPVDYLRGDVDDLRVFDRALDDQEVQQLAAAPR